MIKSSICGTQQTTCHGRRTPPARSPRTKTASTGSSPQIQRRSTRPRTCVTHVLCGGSAFNGLWSIDRFGECGEERTRWICAGLSQSRTTGKRLGVGVLRTARSAQPGRPSWRSGQPRSLVAEDGPWRRSLSAPSAGSPGGAGPVTTLFSRIRATAQRSRPRLVERHEIR